jgi:hypothetical protein
MNVGLFDFLKKEEKKEEFTEKIVVTDNVNKELLKVSKDYNIPLSNLDFDILNVKTYLNVEGDLIEADEHTMSLIESEKFLLNPENEIKQRYEIKIRKYKPDDKFEIIGTLNVNPLYTHATFTLMPNSILDGFNEIKFYDEMNKKKLRNSLLIYILDKQMQKDIKELSKKLLVSKLQSPFKIELCRGIDPIESVEGKVLLLYKKRKKSIKKELIYPVRKGEVVIKIIKPKEGRIGRNCKGEVINVKKPKEFEIPKIDFDQKTIEKKEDSDKIEFIAKKDGFITKEDGKFVIKDKLEIKQINIKTGNVKEGDESKIKMDVKEKDVLKEAIADDMIVETKELIVRGNVGNKAKIKAVSLKIEGQTHKNSIIHTQSARINKHKGNLITKEGFINSLEGGKVKAKKIKIKNALGGEIIAQEVIIENLLSHTKIYALKEIKIKNLKGEENLLSIAPAKVLEDVDVEQLRKEVTQKEQEIGILQKEIRKKLDMWEKNKAAYMDLKSLYEMNKKENKKTSPSVLMKLKEYQMLQRKIKELKEKLKQKKEEKTELLETIDNIQNAIYNAKIISLSPWTPYNRIEFDLLEPPISLKYDTKGNEGICGFKLKFIGDTPKIVKIKVENDSGS